MKVLQKDKDLFGCTKLSFQIYLNKMSFMKKYQILLSITVVET